MLRTELPPSPGIHISHLLVPASILCWPAQNFHTWMREWTINYSCEKLTNVCFPPREPSAVPPSTDSFQRTCLPKTPLLRFSKGCCKRRARSSRWQFHSDQQLRPIAAVTFQLTHPIQSLHTTRTRQPWLSSYIRYMGKQNHCSVFASVRNEMKSVAHIFCWWQRISSTEETNSSSNHARKHITTVMLEHCSYGGNPLLPISCWCGDFTSLPSVCTARQHDDDDDGGGSKWTN